MEQKEHKCVKCEGTKFAKGELRAAGSFWTKIFNIQNMKYATLYCEGCGYTELYRYKKGSSTAGNVLDFFTN